MVLIAVVSAKGGQGKSTLTNAIALASGGAIVTNELHSSMDKVVKAFAKIESEVNLPEFKSGVTVIFDGAQGIHQRSTRQAIERADKVLIPVKLDGSGIEELKRMMWGLSEIPREKAAVVVMKNLEREYLVVKNIVEKTFKGVPVFWIPNSACLEELGDERKKGETLHEKAKTKGLSSYRLKKHILPRFEELMNHLNLSISQ